MGRFLTPDWSEGPATVPYAHLENPQTLNLYGYVDNNPINGIDEDGHSPHEYMVAGAGWDMTSNMASEKGGMTDSHENGAAIDAYNAEVTAYNLEQHAQQQQQAQQAQQPSKPSTSTPTGQCSCEMKSRPLQKVENSQSIPGFVKAFVAIFARHLLFDITIDGNESLVEGWNEPQGTLIVRTLTEAKDIKSEIGDHSRNVGKTLTSCAQIQSLINAASEFKPTRYHLLFGSNSNSAAHWLANRAEWHPVGIFGPFGTPGWPFGPKQQ
jgi:hypothetical protein